MMCSLCVSTERIPILSLVAISFDESSWHGAQIFPGNRAGRDRILSVAGHTNGSMAFYKALSEHYIESEPGFPAHSVIGLRIAAGGLVLTIGFSTFAYM